MKATDKEKKNTLEYCKHSEVIYDAQRPWYTLAVGAPDEAASHYEGRLTTLDNSIVEV